jgi:transposase, IS30 family
MGRHYSHIDLAERRRIQQMRDAKLSVATIAAALGRHRSTIHREINRNFYHTAFRDRWGQAYRGYFCVTADGYARTRRSRRAKLMLRPALRDHVIAKLRDGWSPQQIAGRLKCEALPCGAISHETIYRFVYGPEGQGLNLYALLAVARRRRRTRLGRKPRNSAIPPTRSITERPAEVATRQSFGHWEGDLVIFARQFGKANVTSLQERLSRYHILAANDDRRSAPVIERIAAALAAFPPAARQTITFDRGTEFFAYKRLPMDRVGSILKCDFCVKAISYALQGGYCGHELFTRGTADGYARTRRSRRAKLMLRPALRDHVIAKLRDGWSPQQIAGRTWSGVIRPMPP